MRKIEYGAAATLLHQFSEWLDSNGLSAPPAANDERTHDELVAAFLDERSDLALPEIDQPYRSPAAGEPVPGATTIGPPESEDLLPLDVQDPEHPAGYGPRTGMKIYEEDQ